MIDDKTCEKLTSQVNDGSYGFAELNKDQQLELIRLARLGLRSEQPINEDAVMLDGVNQAERSVDSGMNEKTAYAYGYLHGYRAAREEG